MNQLPPLNDIRVFVTAARTGAFSTAALELDASPAYVSKRIQLLEQSLGVTLFLRSPRRVQLTLEGKVALEWSERLLDTMEQMSIDICREQQAPKGRLRIVTSTGFGSTCLVPLVSELVARHPGLAIDLELLDRPVDLMTEGFDLELRIGGPSSAQAIARKILPNHRILCASPGYIERLGAPVELAEIAEHDVIGIRERDQNYGTWHLHSQQGHHTVAYQARLMSNNGIVAKEWCLNGHGIMLRSIWNVKKELEAGELIQILPDYYQPADIYASYTARLETSAKLRVCVEFLMQELPRRYGIEKSHLQMKGLQP